jgi:SPW repeat
VLGFVLFVSPFLFDFNVEKAAAASAWLNGGLISFVAFIALTDLDEWEEWTNLALGVWVAACPWLFHFDGVTYAMWSHLVVGLLVAVLAAVEIWKLHRTPRATGM